MAEPIPLHLIQYVLVVFVVWGILVCLRALVDFLYHRLMHRQLVAVTVNEDGHLVSYYVKNYANKSESAHLLSRTRQKLFLLLDHLDNLADHQLPSHLKQGIRRMVRKHCHRIRLSELDVTKHQVVAFNQSKGRHIYVCLRECPSCSTLTKSDRVYVVAMHELAHSAMDSYEPAENGATIHGPQYRAYERYLGAVSEELGLLRLDQVIGQPYCDITIPNFMEDGNLR